MIKNCRHTAVILNIYHSRTYDVSLFISIQCLYDLIVEKKILLENYKFLNVVYIMRI